MPSPNFVVKNYAQNSPKHSFSSEKFIFFWRGPSPYPSISLGERGTSSWHPILLVSNRDSASASAPHFISFQISNKGQTATNMLLKHKNTTQYRKKTKHKDNTSGYTTWFMAGGCNAHRSLWRHWWRHNSETIRDREKRRPPLPMKSSELSNRENRIVLRQLCKTGNYVIYDVIIWVQDGNCKKWLERILVLVRSTI